ncbi:MAG TPA: hypothetical protein VEZ42_10725, partial [Pseudonocardia sp.]|nr:hypothetical protein [Pseudonocardia sp.]
MLGIIGVLSGGYAFSGSQPPPPTVLMLPAGMAPEFVPDDAWATRAQVTLASLDQQLATLNEAEQAWRRTPAGRQDLAPPAEIAALQQRADLLEQRRATLQAQLDNYDSLTRAQQDLENTEAHLRSVREALAAAPSEATSREQAATLAALQDQRELRERQLASREEELRSLQDTVRSAIRTPLPDDDEVTEAVRAEAVEAAGIEVGPDPAADQQTPDRDGDADRREPDDDRSDAPTRPADRDADERQPGRDRPDAAARPADPGADQREPDGDPSDADVPTRPGDQDVDLRERDTDAAARPDARAEVPATGPTGSGAGDRPRTPADRDGKTEDRTDGGRGTEPAGDAVSEVDEDLEQRGDAPDRDRPDEAGSADGTASRAGSEDDREGREDRSGRQPAGSAGGPEDTARKDQERPDRPADSGDPDGDEGDGTSDDRRPDDRARIEDR